MRAKQSREDLATASLVVCADVKGEVWPLLSNRWVWSWTSTGRGSILRSLGPDASWYLWAALGAPFPVLSLLPLLRWIMCRRWPRFGSNGLFPFLFCKNFPLLSLSKWEGEGRRKHHVWYLSYSWVTFLPALEALVPWNDHVEGQEMENSPCLLAGSQQLNTASPGWPCWRRCWTFPFEVCLTLVSIFTGVRAMRTIAFHSHNGSFLKIMCNESE